MLGCMLGKKRLGCGPHKDSNRVCPRSSSEMKATPNFSVTLSFSITNGLIYNTSQSQADLRKRALSAAYCGAPQWFSESDKQKKKKKKKNKKKKKKKASLPLHLMLCHWDIFDLLLVQLF